MALSIKTAAEISVSELAELFNLAFTGYIGGNVHFERDSMLRVLTNDNTDLTLSRLLLRDDTLAGLILLSRQGWTCRIGGMGIIPAAQGQGLGKWFLSELIAETRSRGDRAVVLESFKENKPAVALYKSVGFRIVRQLFGYDAATLEGTPDPALREVDILEVANAVMRYGAADLPWQVSGTAIARLGMPNRAFRLGHSYAAISNVDSETLVLRALIVEPEFRRRGEATQMIHALAGRYPGKKWAMPQIFPAEYCDPLLPKLGFVPKPLIQVQMHLDLGLGL